MNKYQLLRLKVKRRSDYFEGIIQTRFEYKYPCRNRTLEVFLENLASDVIVWLSLADDMKYLPLLRTPEDQNEFWDVIMDLFGEKIINHYHYMCDE